MSTDATVAKVEPAVGVEAPASSVAIVKERFNWRRLGYFLALPFVVLWRVANFSRRAVGVILFPPYLQVHLAKFTWKHFKFFWIFPIEGVQLISPAITLGPVLCLAVFYGFPPVGALTIYALIIGFSCFAAFRNAEFQGLLTFVMAVVILLCAVALIGYYFELKLYSRVWELANGYEIPFPIRLVLILSGIAAVIYSFYSIFQLIRIRIKINGKTLTVTRFAMENAIHELRRYDFKTYWHDMNEGAYGCKGLKATPDAPNLETFNWPIIPGGDAFLQLISIAKGIC